MPSDNLVFASTQCARRAFRSNTQGRPGVIIGVALQLEASGAGAQWPMLGFRPDGVNGLCLAWVMAALLLQLLLYTVRPDTVPRDTVPYDPVSVQ